MSQVLDGDELSFDEYNRLFIKILRQLDNFATKIESIINILEQYITDSYQYEEAERIKLKLNLESEIKNNKTNNHLINNKLESPSSNDKTTQKDSSASSIKKGEKFGIYKLSENLILKNQSEYIKVLREEWNNTFTFYIIYINYIKNKNVLDNYECLKNEIVIPTEELVEQTYNNFIHNHFISSDFADIQSSATGKANSPYQIPILNVHKLIHHFRIKVLSLYKLKDTKKSTLMTCACRRFIEICNRILKYPKSIFKILIPLDYDPKDIKSHYEKHTIKNNKIEIDLIQDDLLWFKFKESSKKKIFLIYEGMNEANQKCVTVIADELISASKLHEFHYREPKICFHFLNGLHLEIAEDLSSRGIFLLVENDIESSFEKDKEYKLLKDFEKSQIDYNIFTSPQDQLFIELHKSFPKQNLNQYESTFKNEDNKLFINYPTFENNETLKNFEEKQIWRPLQLLPELVNLDVTTLIVLSADVSHGYQSPEQSTTLHQYHKEQPFIIPRIMRFLNGRKWIVSQQAKDDFLKILYTVAGEEEIIRAEKLLKMTTIVPNDPTERIQILKGISQEHKNIIGTGDKHNAVSITSNITLAQKIHKQCIYPSFYIFNNYSIRLGFRTEFYQNFSRKINQ